jgi:hypothetical protein
MVIMQASQYMLSPIKTLDDRQVNLNELVSMGATWLP